MINTTYPLYDSLGESEEYLAETMFLHLLTDGEEANLTPKDLVAQLDNLLFVWQEVMS